MSEQRKQRQERARLSASKQARKPNARRSSPERRSSQTEVLLSMRNGPLCPSSALRFSTCPSRLVDHHWRSDLLTRGLAGLDGSALDRSRANSGVWTMQIPGSLTAAPRPPPSDPSWRDPSARSLEGLTTSRPAPRKRFVCPVQTRAMLEYEVVAVSTLGDHAAGEPLQLAGQPATARRTRSARPGPSQHCSGSAFSRQRTSMA